MSGAVVKVSGDQDQAIAAFTAMGLVAVTSGPQWINLSGDIEIIRSLKSDQRVLMYEEDDVPFATF
jgi:hypothetical protein